MCNVQVLDNHRKKKRNKHHHNPRDNEHNGTKVMRSMAEACRAVRKMQQVIRVTNWQTRRPWHGHENVPDVM